MIKFVYKNRNNHTHWDRCEKGHAPFIELSNVNDMYVNIFYDVTNYRLDQEQTSEDIKKIYLAYLEFFSLSEPFIDDLFAQYYFLNLIVRREHAEFIAGRLYDYLLGKIKA
ncbi:hypothetical protein [Superficieibacter sp.]|uniref:hypothetical protein n=1 Tax=Superficieibacter sp. TaxID=2303322 RepID=UPI0028ABD228|nr:hypothetical protein [Superficieibacter sp.]